MLPSYTFYIEKPIEQPAAGLSTGANGSTCAALAAPIDIGWPQPAFSMVLQNVCNSGRWVKVDFGWLGAEVVTLALLAFIGHRLVQNAKAQKQN